VQQAGSALPLMGFYVANALVANEELETSCDSGIIRYLLSALLHSVIVVVGIFFVAVVDCRFARLAM